MNEVIICFNQSQDLQACSKLYLEDEEYSLLSFNDDSQLPLKNWNDQISSYFANLTKPALFVNGRLVIPISISEASITAVARMDEQYSISLHDAFPTISPSLLLPFIHSYYEELNMKLPSLPSSSPLLLSKQQPNSIISLTAIIDPLTIPSQRLISIFSAIQRIIPISYQILLLPQLDYYENPNSFKQEVQGDVDAIGEKWFKSMHTETREEIESHDFLATMLIVDPAASGGKKNDYSAYMVGSKTEKFKYCRKGELAKINARTEFDKYVDHMIDLLVQYADITHVSIEKNTFHGADANQLEKKIREHPQLRFRNITIINEAQKKNKDDKISTIIPYVNRGEFIFCSEDEEFNQQIMEFAGQKYSVHDDAPDSAAEFFIRIDNIKTTHGFSIIYR